MLTFAGLIQEREKMNHWHKGKMVTLDKVEKHIHEDSKLEFKSKRYEGDENGYSENSIHISLGKDRSICFAGDNDGAFIYLYPEQVKHLRKILRIK
jgi:hypothetical protein